MSLQMQNIISDLDEFNGSLNALKELLSESKNESLIQGQFKHLLLKYRCNPIIIGLFIDYVQLAKEQQLVNDISFLEIDNCLKKSNEVFETNFDLHLERAYFLFTYLDKNEEALSIAKGIKEAFDKEYEKFISFYENNK